MGGPSILMVMLILSLLVCLGVAVSGGVFTRSALVPWYAHLKKPSWTPPNWVFGPVWTVLYILMAIVGSHLHGVRLALWVLQLVFNFLWSWLFFGLRSPGLALVDIFALWATLVCLMGLVDGLDFWMLVPYLWWVTFASMLNQAIYRMNKGG